MSTCVYKKNFDEAVSRRMEFHEGKMKDRILFSVSNLLNPPYPDRPNEPTHLLPLPPTGDQLPDVCDIKELAPRLDQYFTQFAGITDDKMPISELLNYFGHGVVCEILGHPVKRISLEGYSGSTVEEHLNNLNEAMELNFDLNSPQVVKIREYLQYAQDYADGKWFISPYVMADGLHVLTQLFGYNDAYMMLYDRPDEVHHFLKKMNDINILFFDMQYDISGNVANGYVCNRSDWNPVKCISINLDDYLLCSEEILEEFGIPYMQKAIDHFGTGLIHYHTPDTRLMSTVSKLKNFKIQIGSDLKLPEPINFLSDFRKELPDHSITWMRIHRDDFIRKIKNKELYGNIEYLVSDVIDENDANELYKISKQYRALT